MIGNIYVPSEGDPNSNLWLIGEAPGATEEYWKRPFVGDAGEKLEQVLSRAGYSRSEAFITNLCHYRPAGNKFVSVLGSEQLREGMQEISTLLKVHKPNVIATLGDWPTFYFTNRHGIKKWRGSILSYDPTHFGELNRVQKIIPTYHPAAVLYTASNFIPFDLDIKRVVSDSRFPELNTPQYTIHVNPENLDAIVERIIQRGFTAADIENVKRTTIILCIGFSLSDTEALVVPLGESPSARNRDVVNRILSSTQVTKCFHYGTHDVPMLRINGYEVNSYNHDTIVQAFVLAPELPRSLEFLTSVLTRQPYYKSEGKASIPDDTKGWSRKRDKNQLYIYNGKDVCVTDTICATQLSDLTQTGQLEYYQYRMELQHALQEIGDNGIFRDNERTNILEQSVRTNRTRCAIFLRALAGYKVRNVANKEMVKLFNDTLKLPKRTKTDRTTRKQTITTNEDALISWIAYIKGHIEKLKTDKAKREWEFKLKMVELVLKIRGYNKLLESYLTVPMFADGRARSCYRNGIETGRCANAKYVDGSGLNVQTIPRGKIEVDDDVGYGENTTAA